MKFQRKLNYIISFFPFKRNFILLVALGYGVWVWVKKEYYVDYSSFAEVLLMLGIAITVVFAGLFAIGLLTTLISWIYFLFTHERQLAIRFGIDVKGPVGVTPVRIQLLHALRPFLGFIKVKLVFQDYHQTSVFPLENAVREQRKFFRTGITGAQTAALYDIKEYTILQVVVFFEDMFQLFRFPFRYRLTKSIYTTPPTVALEELIVDPNRTEEDTLRIQTLKRIEGEHLNYKNFESGDDVRRIVWKIYAKNKELVVRIPEIVNPYASHIYMIGSFYQTISVKPAIASFFLNYYKTILENTVHSLKKEGVQIRYLGDQPVTTTFQISEEEKITYQISTAEWQKKEPITEYGDKPGTFLVAVSSLTSVDDIEKLLLAKKKDVIFFWVKLSTSFITHRFFQWTSIFIRKKKNPTDKAVRQWIFSRSRRKILRNERSLKTLLKNNTIHYIEL